MKLSGARILCTAATLLLAHLSQAANPAATSLNKCLMGTEVQLPDTVLCAEIRNEAILVKMTGILRSSFVTRPTDTIKNKAPVSETENVETFDELVAMGRGLNLPRLEILLRKRRKDASENPNLIKHHYDTASIIMLECPALADAKDAVQEAFEKGWYEVLRSLFRHPIWKDRAQERWFWGLISETDAFDPNIWEEGFLVNIFKQDNVDIYRLLLDESPLNKLTEEELCEYIIVFDAINILNTFHPDMLSKIAAEVKLMIEYGPPRIVDQIVNTIHNLNMDTSGISPRGVALPEALRYLFHIKYDQIPMYCLQFVDSQFTINPKCAEWFVANNCVSLLKTVSRQYPDLAYKDKLHELAIEEGNLDVLKFLFPKTIAKRGLNRPCLFKAIKLGHLETIKWLFPKFKINSWEDVIGSSYNGLHSFKVIDYLEDNYGVILKPKVALYRLAMNNDLQGMRVAFAHSPNKKEFSWQDVANGAARGGKTDTIGWVYRESEILPSNDAVCGACAMGNFFALEAVYELNSTAIAFEDRNSINVLTCLNYAVLQDKPEEMEWILSNPLNGMLPSASAIYTGHTNVPEEAYLKTLKWIASKGDFKVDEKAAITAVSANHIQIFLWLLEQGVTITPEVVQTAVKWGNLGIIKAIYKITPSLVCTANNVPLAASSWVVWRYNVLEWMKTTCDMASDEHLWDDYYYFKRWGAERRRLFAIL